jgi:hypothetical protein
MLNGSAGVTRPVYPLLTSSPSLSARAYVSAYARAQPFAAAPDRRPPPPVVTSSSSGQVAAANAVAGAAGRRRRRRAV